MCPLHGRLVCASLWFDSVNKRFEEERSRTRSSKSATRLEKVSDDRHNPEQYCTTVTYVAKVSVGGIDLRPVVLVEGHAPEAVVLRFTSRMKFLPEFI